MPKVKFIVYTAGLNSSNVGTVNAFKEACSQHFKKNSFEVTVEDILQDSTLADEHKILAIPTIIRTKPKPEKRIVGEFRAPDLAKEALNYLVCDLEL